MRARSIVRRAIGVWLIVDGATTGLWFASLTDSLGARGAISGAAMATRLLVAAFSVVAGWLIAQGRPQGTPLGVAGLALIAVFGLAIAWTGILPTNLDPSFRWPVAVIQTVVAAGAVVFLRK